MIKVYENVKENFNYLTVVDNVLEVILIEDFEDDYHVTEDHGNKVVKDILVLNIHEDITIIKDKVVEIVKETKVVNEVSMDVMDMVKNVNMTNNKIIND